jgi:predicted RNA-binding Zn-ribbon protein involved in translation (DUF1610 family)
MERATTLESQRNDLEQQRRGRETRWAWIGAAIATAVLILVFRAVYEHSIGQAGPLRCEDGWRSPSVGIQGACSSHGGVDYGPVRWARRLGWLAGLPAALVTWVVVLGIEFLTSPFRARLKQLPAADDAGRKVNVDTNASSSRCPRCGGEVITKIKYHENQMPDRTICKRCKECKWKEYLLLE